MGKNQKNKTRLDSLNKELPFSVPENYFDTFYGRLQNRMQVESKPGVFRKTYQMIRPQLALAAAIAAFIVIGYTTARLILNENGSTETIVEITDVIDFYIYDFDDDMLISTLTEEEGVDWVNTRLETEDILDFLSEENNIDYLELIDIY